MKTFIVKTNWEGYSRGFAEYEIEAEDEEEARELYHEGEVIAHVTVRDDTEDEVDHIDGDGQNNKISNLRAISHKNNMRNMKKEL